MANNIIFSDICYESSKEHSSYIKYYSIFFISYTIITSSDTNNSIFFEQICKADFNSKDKSR